MMSLVNIKEGTKPMHEMVDGEVCFCIDTNEYVIKISHIMQKPIFLILNEHKATNSYGAECYRRVRQLNEGESVTIRFS